MPAEAVEIAKPSTHLPEIPEPNLVRERLGQCLRETRILRQLLRVAERAAKEKGLRKEARHAS